MKKSRIDRGTPGIVNAARAARDDDALTAGKLSGGRFARGDLRVNAEIANLARDQMAILSPCVEDGDLWVQIGCFNGLDPVA